MVSIYSGFVKIGNEDPDSMRVDITLPKLFESTKIFFVEGVNIWRKKNPQEWQDYLNKLKTNLEKSGKVNDDEISEIITDRNRFNAHYQNNKLYMISYPVSKPRYDAACPKKAIFDKNLNIVAEVTTTIRQIDCFRLYYQDSNNLNEYFSHNSKFAMQNPFLYDGTIKDALTVFAEADYIFNLWDKKWFAGDLENGKRTKNLNGATPIKNVSLDDVFKFVEKNQRVCQV